MNRNNIWIHISIAVVVITLAAVLGQIRLWENSLHASRTASDNIRRAGAPPPPPPPTRSFDNAEPEVLVRFRPGVSVSDIKRIAVGKNDRLKDEFESVSGLAEIDDLD